MSDSTNKSSKGKTYVLLFIAALLLIAGGYWYVKKDSSTFKKDTYEKQIKSLAEMEKSNPVKFLQAGGDFSKNLIGTKFKIHGKISNKATIANFKDITLDVAFFSETKTLIEKREIVVYDVFPANTSKDFELKVDRPQGSKNVTWTIVSATPY
jgi:hypothetical protein